MNEEERQRIDAFYANRIRNEAMEGDTEGDHMAADDILVDLLSELGMTETIKQFGEVSKWYA